MSKFDLNNANINATNLHIGDIYNYSSSQEFLNRNSDLKFTETEIELVKIIFAHTDSEQERNEILKSLKAINNNDESVEDVKKTSISAFKPLLDKLKSIGEKVSVGLISKYLIDYASSHKLIDFANSLL